MKEMEDAGFHGCVGSMDATQVKMDMCCHGLQTANLGYKMPFAARTYNITVNQHRRKILSSTCGHPSRWNDKCLVRFDEFATKLRNGEIMDNNFFNLYKYDDDGNAVSVRYRGAWIMVDGGYHPRFIICRVGVRWYIRQSCMIIIVDIFDHPFYQRYPVDHAHVDTRHHSLRQL